MSRILVTLLGTFFLLSCSQVDIPGPRNLKIPAPTQAKERTEAINERPDSVLYLPLGEDVLIPESPPTDPLPNDIVGPFELRSETLAGALQLILSDYEIPMAFESEEALTRTITVSNMRGPINRVVRRVCGLADLYCAYEEGILTVKETQTFTISIPPVGGDSDIIDAIAGGIEAITEQSTITDTGTRTIIYEATHRSAELVNRYFQRMRNNTALIVFEVYIWEVTLENENATGINWEEVVRFGEFNTGFNIAGSVPSDLSPISIGLPTKGNVSLGNDEVFQFISTFGAVKTISQPKITMLSGASATLRAVDTVNYVSSLERTVDTAVGGGDEISLSTQTDSVDTGFELTIGSNWDNASVYSNIQIELDQLQSFDNFDTGIDGDSISLPITTERDLTTQVRIRPGDSLLIAGLVRETDQFASEGPGFTKPILPTSRSTNVENVELVFLLKPRVIVYTNDAKQREIVNVEQNAVKKVGDRVVQSATTAPENKAQQFNNVLQKVNSGALTSPKTNSSSAQAMGLVPIPSADSSNETASIRPSPIESPVSPSSVYGNQGAYIRPTRTEISRPLSEYVPPIPTPSAASVPEESSLSAEPNSLGTLPVDLLNPTPNHSANVY